MFDSTSGDLLLDSSVQVDVLRGTNGRTQAIEDLLRRGYRLHASVINLAEIYAGMRPNEEALTDAFLASILHLPVTREIAHRGGLLRRNLRKKGITIAIPDILIAATALTHDLVVVTDNQRHFLATEAKLFPPNEL